MAFVVLRCNFMILLPPQIIYDIREVIQYVFLIFPQFCLGDSLIKLSRNQLFADIYARFNIDKYINPFSFEMLGWNFVAMGASGFVFLILNVLIECQCCGRWVFLYTTM